MVRDTAFEKCLLAADRPIGNPPYCIGHILNRYFRQLDPKLYALLLHAAPSETWRPSLHPDVCTQPIHPCEHHLSWILLKGFDDNADEPLATSAKYLTNGAAENYEVAHAFTAYSNWLIRGRLMLGRYPFVEPSRVW